VSWLKKAPEAKTYIDSQQYAGFISKQVPMMKILIAAAISALAFTPASAEMMACAGDNMAKTNMMMTTMADGPAKRSSDGRIFWESAGPHSSESGYIAAPCPAPFNPTP
jgi:hypothetical protein